MDSSERKMSFSERLKSLGIESSFHSIPSLVQSEHPAMKLTWIVFFVVSFGFCTWTVCTNVQDFLAYPVETVVEVVHDSDADFPTVTFCEHQKCVFGNYDYAQYIDYFIQEAFNKSFNLTK